jgi:hypothetical protein
MKYYFDHGFSADRTAQSILETVSEVAEPRRTPAATSTSPHVVNALQVSLHSPLHQPVFRTPQHPGVDGIVGHTKGPTGPRPIARRHAANCPA